MNQKRQRKDFTEEFKKDAVSLVTEQEYSCSEVAWIYASRLAKTPNRRHVVKGREHFAFSDVRRSVAKAAMDDNFGVIFPVPHKSAANSLVAVLLRLAA
jgi:hypothetical protein